MSDVKHTNDLFGEKNFESFFERSLSGFLIADAQGIIIRSNTRLANWFNVKPADLSGKRFSDLLTIGGKIYYETHLWPLLRMQGFFDEVVVELNTSSGQKLRVLISGLECKNENDNPECIHYIISKATDRLQYEQNLQYAKTVAEKELLTEKENVLLREQLIAVLGHDLRNPIGAISMAIELLQHSFLNAENEQLLALLKRSSHRMTELISNIMDFARTRLGGGIKIKKQTIKLEPVLEQVAGELQLIFPKREIVKIYDIDEALYCDPHRIAQLLSNLIANALTHGSTSEPVYVKASGNNKMFKLAVCNSGEKIPVDLHERLFAPFTREGNRPSQNGLGLGLYISSEIAKAHNGTLTCTSTEEETCFTFEMALPDN